MYFIRRCIIFFMFVFAATTYGNSIKIQVDGKPLLELKAISNSGASSKISSVQVSVIQGNLDYITTLLKDMMQIFPGATNFIGHKSGVISALLSLAKNLTQSGQSLALFPDAQCHVQLNVSGQIVTISNNSINWDNWDNIMTTPYTGALESPNALKLFFSEQVLGFVNSILSGNTAAPPSVQVGVPTNANSLPLGEAFAIDSHTHVLLGSSDDSLTVNFTDVESQEQNNINVYEHTLQIASPVPAAQPVHGGVELSSEDQSPPDLFEGSMH